MNIVNVIDAMAEAEENRFPRYDKVHHYARDFLKRKDEDTLVGMCVRENWYSWMKVGNTDMAVKSLYNFKGGRMWENEIAHLLEQYPGWSVERERPVMIHPEALKYAIKGKIDFVLRSPDGKETILVELKTTHGRAMTNKFFGVKYKGPKDDHVMQLSYYFAHADGGIDLHFKECKEKDKALLAEMKLLDKKDPRRKSLRKRRRTLREELARPKECKPTEAILLYFSREDFFRLQFSTSGDGLPLDLIEMNDVRCFVYLEKFIEERKIPPRTFDDPKKFPCSYCFHCTRCYQVDGDDSFDEEYTGEE